jgi:hypothetical protein
MPLLQSRCVQWVVSMTCIHSMHKSDEGMRGLLLLLRNRFS